ELPREPSLLGMAEVRAGHRLSHEERRPRAYGRDEGVGPGRAQGGEGGQGHHGVPEPVREANDDHVAVEDHGDARPAALLRSVRARASTSAARSAPMSRRTESTLSGTPGPGASRGRIQSSSWGTTHS